MSPTPISWPRMKRPLLAILRGVRPEEVEPIAGELISAGFEAIEVPLNSPSPFDSIERLSKRYGAAALIGAGTVLSQADCARVREAGGKLVVSPNLDPSVLQTAIEGSMITLPGVFSPTEALLALRFGASALKFFPAAGIGPRGISAIRAILPKETVMSAVGGISHRDFAEYAALGINSFGLGGSLYRPGFTVSEVALTAKTAIQAYDEAIRNEFKGV